MTKEKVFKLHLKNDQIIELKFTPIAVANDQLWQMFATTEALDTVQALIDVSYGAPIKSVKASGLKQKK